MSGGRGVGSFHVDADIGMISGAPDTEGVIEFLYQIRSVLWLPEVSLPSSWSTEQGPRPE
jgi:hypothetical protein